MGIRTRRCPAGPAPGDEPRVDHHPTRRAAWASSNRDDVGRGSLNWSSARSTRKRSRSRLRKEAGTEPRPQAGVLFGVCGRGRARTRRSAHHGDARRRNQRKAGPAVLPPMRRRLVRAPLGRPRQLVPVAAAAVGSPRKSPTAGMRLILSRSCTRVRDQGAFPTQGDRCGRGWRTDPDLFDRSCNTGSSSSASRWRTAPRSEWLDPVSLAVPPK